MRAHAHAHSSRQIFFNPAKAHGSQSSKLKKSRLSFTVGPELRAGHNKNKINTALPNRTANLASMKHGYLALIVLCACTMEVVNCETMSEKTRRSPLEDFLSQIRGEGLLNSRMRFGKRIPAAQRPWNLDNYYAGLYLHPRIYQSYSDSFT
ncbi:hypothetical protein T02_12892 [Trichinella nativa]|uniref:Uncharacterized protein n=2 Tax=Trichinella TaxID=6333 RepID=A0A0V1LM64_9BILA|nr:hypothetical protein T05_6994 [Trichinella murrelli]KRX72983.1 hypothetical protein T06_9300 [Trichinella sp. T6]KRZ60586.1 hypothetical protein T02_12892 [Trichinella nativa]KRZ94327.1 hypothetical protein T08_8543 [Trichinella sp. T8]